MMRFLLVLSLLALPAAADTVDAIFKVWDANGDGVLDKSEVPEAAVFANYDRDKDGKVTRAELAAALGVPKPSEPTRKGAKKANAKKKKDAKKTEEAMKAPRTVKERVAAFYKRFDANKDKKVQKTEFPAADRVFAGRDMVYRNYDKNKDDALAKREVTRYITALLKAARAAPRPDNFFDLFDLNRDDKVTRAEYKGGPRMFFRSYDHNRNNVVTREEMNMGANQSRSARVMRQDQEFMADGPTQAPKLGLLERYDKNKDGRITLKELDDAESVLHRLDKNKDGVLSGSEVK